MQAALQGASATEPDDEGLQYLDRQRHATAVQLHSRQLSIALLRAQIKMPRGCTLSVKPHVQHHIKAEPATDDMRGLQTPGIHDKQWHRDISKPKAIVVNMSSTAADLHLDSQQLNALLQQPQTGAGSKHTALKPRPLVHRQPDTAAAQQFMQDAAADELAGDAAAPGGATAPVNPAPRMVADPAHVGQQLAGWTRVAAPGEAGEAEVREDVGLQDEDMLGAGMEDEGDMMDEEEWV